ncbi:SMP-30/gluconolactonase/LRE family protein [Cerasicoccus arenae]|uniref:Regucalcin n=1 Tax=Cerasicoccus arenae TaxID=424488 RepID=A0A8J3GCT5_9BACT|nr:SMP-30/gluconolactonase/LRE family protein [Cerasicoccus arenae]MBK1858331.1 SMP-30/gluconolactonase/LRE family protein [Cerasicoccus arenae]GHB90823.1 regucalcin-like protein [Cerasicoccus arenae]
MKTYTATLLTDHAAVLGEGPFWHDGAIHYVDIEGKQLLRLEGENVVVVYEFPRRVGAVVPAKEGGFVCALEEGFYHLSADGDDLTYLTDPEPGRTDNRFNDGKCDPFGRFVAGTMSLVDDNEGAALYSLGKDGSCQQVLAPVGCSNGLAWSKDQKHFFYIDTPTRQIVRFDYAAETGAISNRKVCIEIPAEDGHPDGMCIDQDDHLWIAHWGGWQVARYNPATGQKMEHIHVPAAQVTSCAFGGGGMNELYITTGCYNLTSEQRAEQPHAGKVFVCPVDAVGFPTATWG